MYEHVRSRSSLTDHVEHTEEYKPIRRKVGIGLQAGSNLVAEVNAILATSDLFRMPHGEIPERNQYILHCRSKDAPYDTHILTVIRR
jgi:hypothetical protein